MKHSCQLSKFLSSFFFQIWNWKLKWYLSGVWIRKKVIEWRIILFLQGLPSRLSPPSPVVVGLQDVDAVEAEDVAEGLEFLFRLPDLILCRLVPWWLSWSRPFNFTVSVLCVCVFTCDDCMNNLPSPPPFRSIISQSQTLSLRELFPVNFLKRKL